MAKLRVQAVQLENTRRSRAQLFWLISTWVVKKVKFRERSVYKLRPCARGCEGSRARRQLLEGLTIGTFIHSAHHFTYESKSRQQQSAL